MYIGNSCLDFGISILYYSLSILYKEQSLCYRFNTLSQAFIKSKEDSQHTETRRHIQKKFQSYFSSISFPSQFLYLRIELKKASCKNSMSDRSQLSNNSSSLILMSNIYITIYKPSFSVYHSVTQNFPF